jgi:CRISPR-associated protein Cas5d
MLLDMDYSDPQDIRPMFFRAVLQDGVLVVPPLGGEGVVR